MKKSQTIALLHFLIGLAFFLLASHGYLLLALVAFPIVGPALTERYARHFSKLVLPLTYLLSPLALLFFMGNSRAVH